jgi:RHH-type rel operon transcriptional repressor/antitoxin RelB
MSESSISFRLPEKTKSKLDALAKASGRSRSMLASEAIADFVDRETAIQRGIEKACKELDAGLGIPHEKAMKSMKETIKKASTNKKAFAKRAS